MRNKGFTIIELLTVIAMIGILIAILQPMLSIAASRTRDFTCESNLKQSATALLAYSEDYGVFPADLRAADSVLRDKSLLTCPGTMREYVYAAPAKDSSRDAVVMSCIDPKRHNSTWPHRQGKRYNALTAGGEMRRVSAAH